MSSIGYIATSEPDKRVLTVPNTSYDVIFWFDVAHDLEYAYMYSQKWYKVIPIVYRMKLSDRGKFDLTAIKRIMGV